jgi:hypothetical protein
VSSSESFENAVIESFRHSGASVERYASKSRWRPDIVLATPDKSTILVNVRPYVTTPDILSVVSARYSTSGANTVMPVIISNHPSPDTINETARLSGVIVVTADEEEELQPKLRFVVRLAEIEGKLRALAKASSKTSVRQIVESLQQQGVLSQPLADEILLLWEKRTTLAHSIGAHDNFDPVSLEAANRVMQALSGQR